MSREQAPSGGGKARASSPFATRRFIGAAVFVALVAVLGALIVVVRAFGDGGARPAAEASPGAVVTAPGSSAPGDPGAGEGDSVCGLAPGDQSVPSGPLDFTPVRAADGVVVPSIEGVGPASRSASGITTCFAHSPTGALLAAVNQAKWSGSGADPAGAHEELMAPSADRDAIVAADRSAAPRQGWEAPRVVGYRIVVVSGDEAVVTLAQTHPTYGDGFFWTRYVLRWSSGDWKVVAPPGGDWSGSVGAGSSITGDGFVPWTA